MTATISTLRVRSAPPLEPPYDDEPDRRHAGDPLGTLGQPLLPCFVLTGGDVPAGPDLELDFPRETLADRNRFCRQRTSSSRLPEPRNHARKLVQALMEMISGVRPLGQLVPWLHEALYFELSDRYGAVREANRRATTRCRNRQDAAGKRSGQLRTRVGGVRICEAADGITEISAVVHERDRTYAVALRMEGLDGAWRCTDFTVI